MLTKALTFIEVKMNKNIKYVGKLSLRWKQKII